jgi:hypothetical protein
MWRNIMRHQGSRTHHRPFADFDSAHDDSATAKRCSATNDGRLQLPIPVGLWLTVRIGCPRGAVINKHHAMADKHLIFNSHTLADEAMTRDFAPSPDPGSTLDFDERSDSAVVADFASVKVDERAHPYARPQPHIIGDAGMRR